MRISQVKKYDLKMKQLMGEKKYNILLERMWRLERIVAKVVDLRTV